jgi:hypothetical protein
MVESVPIEGKTTKKGKPRKVGHLKMFVIDDLKAKIITQMVTDNVSENTVVDSDHST